MIAPRSRWAGPGPLRSPPRAASACAETGTGSDWHTHPVPSEIWERVLTTQPAPPGAVVLALGVLAVVLTWTRPGYRSVRHLVTLVHEAGHAGVALLTGRRLRGIRLHSDTSGLTVSSGRPSGPGMVATLAGGYPAPAVLGLLGALLLARGYAVALLWAGVLACALMLLAVRNLYGLWVVLVTGGLVAAASWWLAPELLSLLAHLLVWCLVVAAPRSVVELQGQRRRGGAAGSDVDQLAGLTGLPGPVWIGVFWVVCTGCLVATGLVLTAPLRG